MLQLLAAAPAAVVFTWTDAEAQEAHTHAQAAQTTAQKTGTSYKPKFFNAHEWATIGMLANIIIPKDDRSGSATDAAVPEFMDFMMVDQPGRQTAMRGGLAWLDRECATRYDKMFVDCTDAERTKVLDDIAWPSKTPTGTVARRRVLQYVPRSHRQRVLDQQDGDQGSPVHRQRVRAGVERVSGRSAEEAGRDARLTPGSRTS